MSRERLGLAESVSFALGGIIGGGIFAVLGVVVMVAGPTAWVAYLVAGIVVMATGYSYVKLSERTTNSGGSGGAVTFLERSVGNSTIAGIVGWTLLVGYVGTIAMYAYAFGAYFGAIFGLTELPVLGVPSRPVLSMLVVVGFVGVNLVGVRESGLVEDLLVAVKLLIVAGFGALGVWYGFSHGRLEFGAGQMLKNPSGPVLAAAVAFVSFEGWQLLFYDRDRIENPVETIRKAVYVSIPVATLSYVLVAFVTVSLVPRAEVVAHPDLALAIAARQFAGQVGYVLIGVAAVASTASAINATLFSTAQFATGMSRDDLLPDRLAPARESGVPRTTLLIIGGLTALFSVFGSLTAITEFASLSFIVVFGTVNYLAYTHRSELLGPIPLVGLVGTSLFVPLFTWHLYTHEPRVLLLIVGIGAVLLVVEGLYFERERIETGIRTVEKRL